MRLRWAQENSPADCFPAPAAGTSRIAAYGLPAQGNGSRCAREKSRYCDTRPESPPHGSLSFLSRGCEVPQAVTPRARRETGAACLLPGGPLPARGSPAARPVPGGPARAVPSCAFLQRPSVSTSAEVELGRCPNTPPPFEKGGRKLLLCFAMLFITKNNARYSALCRIPGVVVSSCAVSRAGHPGHVCCATAVTRAQPWPFSCAVRPEAAMRRVN